MYTMCPLDRIVCTLEPGNTTRTEDVTVTIGGQTSTFPGFNFQVHLWGVKFICFSFIPYDLLTLEGLVHDYCNYYIKKGIYISFAPSPRDYYLSS